MASDDSFSRRNVLRATGSSMVGGAATGLAAADPGESVEVSVGFSAERGRRAALDAASEVVREFDSLDAVTVRVPKRAVEALDGRSDVRYVEQNGRMQALAQSLPWGIDRVGADTQTAEGNGADVAVIDTGIDSDHPDLEANLGKGAYAVQCDPYNNACGTCHYKWDDDNGHGTRIALIIAAADNAEGILGVASQATLHAVKVLDSSGGGSYSDIAAGIEYTADQGWDVGSLSLGGSASSVIRDAIEYADSRGVTIITPAGNSGPCSDCVVYPAAYPETIAVSATNSSDGLASFSSTGPEVDIAAPGSGLYIPDCGTQDSYDSLSGTSFAAAHVSGGAAILRAQGYSNSQAKSRLLNTAEDIGLGSNEQGAGLLDVDGL